MAAQFTIEQRLDYYSYIFTSDDQCILFFSRLYSSLSHCRRGIKELQEHVSHFQNIEKMETGSGYSFFIRNKKSELLGHSIIFFAVSSRDFGIRKIEREAAAAKIIEPVSGKGVMRVL